ncbi:MAG: LodA/GoxA family CTQ-dependent oxidase [Actinomycetota bacterium]|nr:LodA/GoxA family CTQ-dependent oxidase [Actinomycetota bacterium]
MSWRRDGRARVERLTYRQSPGTVSRWMAVPWQTDTASCRSGYYLGYGPRFDRYVPTFWAARVPNQVLTRRNYEVVWRSRARSPSARRRSSGGRSGCAG